MRQRFHSYLIGLLAMLAVSACVEPLIEDNPNRATVPIRFRVCTSDAVVKTKSAAGRISGTDAAVTAIYLYCFDENGRFVGRFPASDVTSTYAAHEPNDEGTFKGLIPPATARIHFVANADIPVGNDKIGMTEEQIFHGQDASTWGLTACLRDQIAYWGYHKEATAAALAELFDPANTTTTTIYLLRDRARIQAGVFNTAVNPHYDPASVRWVIYNGKSTGYVAPYDATHKFEDYYTNEEGTMIPSSTISPQANPARDETDADDLVRFEPGSYMYAFEDRNVINGNDISEAIRIIVELKTKVSTESPVAQTLYFPIRLTDKDGNDQLQIMRGHEYKINLDYLPGALGYDSFAEAAAASSFANGQMVSIPVTVPEVSDGTYDLRIDYTLGEDELISTSALFEEWPDNNPVVRIPFEFDKVDGTSVAADDFAFQASWTEENQTVADDTYNDGTNRGIKIITTDIPSGGFGYLEIKLKEVEVGKLKSGVIRLVETKHKLERNVNIYSIQWFRYRDLQLVKNGTGYRLYLQLPSGEHFSEYPEGLYPLHIRMASKFLRPAAVWNGSSFANMTQTQNVVFGVEVKTTRPGSVVGISSWGTDDTDWRYQGTSTDPDLWNFWYTYTVVAKSEGKPCYWIDFTDIRSNYGLDPTASTAGLYFRIEFFGDGPGGTNPVGQFGGNSIASEAIALTGKATYVAPTYN